ncbi:hypothetical protein ASG40_02180 [Methylobacterium sp. Leaf399]|uniref:hypothetical protein n=1 Tax=Methylobacterium sp. Leaf399 TaxID=1736364 RepID=UPI0006F54A24|nr:hypothetical protein [Methylobacterium sp. Leaf399]KQT20093.1 hypothetical protein ASG40_02180 [Methylobacterium sp. Leaf399]
MTLAPVMTDPAASVRPAPRAGSRAVPVSSLVVFLALAATLLAAADPLLNDPDSQWHVAVGRWIVDHRTLPWTDLFSHTFAGRPWIAKEWASQVIFAGAHGGAGWWGVAVVAIVSTGVALAVMHGWLRARVGPMAALVGVVLAFVVLAPHLLARPHIFTLPVIVAWTIGLVGARERGLAPPLWLALAMTAWANLHGSYPIGLVLAGLIACEGVVDGPRALWRGRAAAWGLFLAASAAAALATPYGIRPLLVNLTLFGGGGESLRFIAEWQPIRFDGPGLAALGACAVALWVLAAEPRANAFRIGLVLILAAMMVRHSRFMDLFVLVAPFLVAGPAARRFSALRTAATSLAPTTGRAWSAVIALAAVVLVLAATAAPQPAPTMTPVAALEAARAKGLTGPVYNDYDFGGFLIGAGVPTFIDGRADQIFLGGFMNDLHRAVDAADHAPFDALLRRHGVTWALVRAQGAEAGHLSALDGWTLLHRDPVAAVYMRDR